MVRAQATDLPPATWTGIDSPHKTCTVREPFSHGRCRCVCVCVCVWVGACVWVDVQCKWMDVVGWV